MIGVILRGIYAVCAYPFYVVWVLLIACFSGDPRGRFERMTKQLWTAVQYGDEA